MGNRHPSILRLDVAGNPCDWITYEDAAYYYAKDLIAWTAGGNDFTIRGGDNRITGKQSTLDINTIIAIRGSGPHAVIRRTPALDNVWLFRRDQNICAYCGNVFKDIDLTRDHVVPTSRGGKDVWTNVVTACGPCNRKKDDKMLEECGMQLLYVPYAPNMAEFLILRNRSILEDQMEYLMAHIPENSRIRSQLEKKNDT